MSWAYSWGKQLRGLLTLGFLGLTVFPSVVASAEDDDLKDIKGTRRCKDETYKRLRKEFVEKCKKEENRPLECYDSDILAVLEDKVRRFRECIVAREALMNQCFGGGDDGHKEQVEGLERGLKKCNEKLEKCREQEIGQCPQ